MKRMVTLGAAGVALAAGSYFGLHQVDEAAANEAASKTFFTQTFPDAAGKPFALADFRGKTVVVNFWATWCVPCVEEIPELSRLSTEYAPRNVAFVGIGIDSASNIAEFQTRIKASYPLLVAGAHGSDLVREYGDAAGGLPYTLLLNDKGAIVETKLGRVSEKEIRAWLKPLARN